MKKLSEYRKNFLQDFLLVSLILCLVAVFSYTGILDYVNWKLFDLLVTSNRSTPVHRDNVVFVCIDQKSIDYFDKNTGNSWPWPREFHGFLVSHLAECGAKAIVFDVIFSAKDIDRFELGSTGEESDNEFATAISESGITYLAVVGQPETSIAGNQNDKIFVEETEIFQKFNNLPNNKSALFPLKKFSRGSKGLGLVNLDPENDGIHRRYPLVSKLGGNYVPSLGFAVVRDILDKQELKHRILDNIGRSTFLDS